VHSYRLLLGLAGVFALLRFLRYALGARIFLCSAIQEGPATPCADSALPDGEREILESFDSELAQVGWRPLGYLAHAPLLTYYGGSEYVRVFSSPVASTEIQVSRRLAPEYGMLLKFQLTTSLRDGRSLLTTDVGIPLEQWVPTVTAEVCPGATLHELLARHQQRVAGVERDLVVADSPTLEAAARSSTHANAAVRAEFRKRRWSVSTRDPSLDRITLRGAFCMVNRSMQAFGRKGVSRAPPAERTEENRRRRIEADLLCVRHVAREPRTAPGTPWPLLAMIAATAIASIAGMAALWNLEVSLVIFAVLLLHEAGHAIAMRIAGHSAVHIFFVPFLGALTVGQPTNPSIGRRLAILLAGPVPGLGIAVALLAVYATEHQRLWLVAAVGFLFINALNLLPVVPLDGGRFFEVLTRPEGVLRLVLQWASTAGLAGLAWALEDPVLAGLALVFAFMIPRQLQAFRFRRALAERIADRSDWDQVARAALLVMATDSFATWRSPARQMYARTAADQFIAPLATAKDWAIGIVGYVLSIVIGAVALVQWALLRGT
jgi:Zn-dependent protease